MDAASIVLFIVVGSYIIYRSLTPKKGDTTSTAVGRFFGALFRSVLTLIVVGTVIQLIQIFIIRDTTIQYFNFLQNLTGK